MLVTEQKISSEGPSITAEPKQGASLSMVYMDRKVPGYVIAETELEEIIHSSILVDFGILVFSSSTAFGLCLYKDVVMQGTVPPAVEPALLVYELCAVVAVISVAAGAFTFWQIIRRRRKINKIKEKRGWWASLASWWARKNKITV